jgi:hypothetical protein
VTASLATPANLWSTRGAHLYSGDPKWRLGVHRMVEVGQPVRGYVGLESSRGAPGECGESVRRESAVLLRTANSWNSWRAREEFNCCDCQNKCCANGHPYRETACRRVRCPLEYCEHDGRPPLTANLITLGGSFMETDSPVSAVGRTCM